MVLTPRAAKLIIQEALKSYSLPAYKLTARTVSFEDPARGEKIFVRIHGWQPSPLWKDLHAKAQSYGFIIETGGF